ncbi:GW dipeptide domain-containing protein [Fodinibius sp.]|uniref:GW dipeptide domain-containing protein n=1 Tax=Fodinibius sp. TaxID=1872440 RepID=UPI002ACE50DD|nr:GW dipeptide domain-containing protein [Fodinibius sp.]MDZ7658730.1 GW dipeptide domain-containing protein [Fodinibius sp.]
MFTNRTPKIFLFLFLFGGFVALSFAQQNAQALFDNANEMLQEGNYQQAISSYQKLEDRNTVSGALFLNMGISYQRIDSLGMAKYYFLKASQFEETEQQAQKALQFVESRFSRQSAVLPKLPWDIATGWLQEHIGAENILLIGIITLNIGVFIFIAHWFLQAYPKVLRIGGLSLIVVALLIIASSFYTQYISERYSKAVMVTEKVSVLAEPAEEASIVSRAYEGYTFTVDHRKSDSRQEWTYVRMSNGLYGWIPNSEILIL